MSYKRIFVPVDGSAPSAKGMSEAEFLELVSVIGMASETNRLAAALQVPVDEAFRREP